MSQQEKSQLSGSLQERLMWLVLAVVALSVPLWYEIAAQPGEYIFSWRWTEYQVLVESIISVVHLVIVICGFFMLRKAVGDMPQWSMVRLGTWIWIALVAIFALFSVLMFNIAENEVIESYEDEGYKVNFVRVSGSEEDIQIFSVLSCNHTLLYKNLLHLDRFIGAEKVDISVDTDSVMTASYVLDDRVVREQRYDLAALYTQCREGHR
ncbi:hypothetical protein CWE09_09075 [Aliidiomarina minuta]|uniref:Uncharacterized protein n=1 Tax=Aliidiomarina minuta TaxID=880057 RepID=A0A432W9M1_9GAMM|nr:hypothetical protein [Aliidiomarina minuta]RUO26824.1 hypothetical protein CWE09_09075 [Aliidiomarina minuta]